MVLIGKTFCVTFAGTLATSPLDWIARDRDP
jgi:hypothetical protein